MLVEGRRGGRARCQSASGGGEATDGCHAGGHHGGRISIHRCYGEEERRECSIHIGGRGEERREGSTPKSFQRGGGKLLEAIMKGGARGKARHRREGGEGEMKKIFSNLVSI